MPTTTSRLALQQPVTGDSVAELRIAIGSNAGTLDNAVLFGEGTLAARPVSTVGTPGIAGRRYLATDQSPAPGVEYLDYGTGWVPAYAVDQAASVASMRTLGTGATQAMPGNASLTRVTRQYHSFTTDDQTSPNPVASTLGSFFVDPAGSETVKLVEAVVHCVSVGSPASVFKVQTDHAAHGSLVNVPGLTALTPAVAQTAVTPTGGSMVLSALDRVTVVLVTAGASLGCTVQLTTEHSA